MIFSTSPASLSPLRQAINDAYLADEETHVAALLPLAALAGAASDRTEALARELVVGVRQRPGVGTLDAFLHQYDLSTQEGVMLMCLAEALLRIPDDETADRLIKDKLSQAQWDAHLGQSSSLFVNASTWGLILTGRIVRMAPDIVDHSRSFFSRLVGRSGEPVIRLAIKQAMRIIGQQFIMGATIEEALERSAKGSQQAYRYSFDMLGEAALTRADARRYFEAYSEAINALALEADPAALLDNPGISIKLSALHPRYEFAQRGQVLAELPPLLKQLALQAKAAHISLTIDAEEAERLDLSLDLFEGLYSDPDLGDWDGLGLALQAYQKRAVYLIDWLTELGNRVGRRIPVRLVKGAYWDTEIKRAQERGLSDYPVFTRKASTDLSYLACAKKLLDGGARFYPQFATHNAHTLAAITTLAGERRDYEFQRLHGMGEALYGIALEERAIVPHCRVYAPVGNHKELLPYLVRRLLENGANTSFVNRIIDEQTPVDELIADPVREVEILQQKRHPRIPLPRDIFQPQRRNASGINLSDIDELRALDAALDEARQQSWQSGPIIDGNLVKGSEKQNVLNPADGEDIVGTVSWADGNALEQALASAHRAAPGWNATTAGQRADILRAVADELEAHRAELMALAISEGGRTLGDALAEVREAIDFCRYYAHMAEEDFSVPRRLPGVTGERNELRLEGRGVFACISPWNFPISIFTGQIAAALAAGNSVVAKPASLAPLCAARVVRLMHQAGVPPQALHLLPGGGQELGMALVKDPRVAGVAFTGSTETARQINLALAQRPVIVPFIAETGGLNSMIIDSSALPEQVVADVMTSAFNSAGQRCSALRVLFVQEEVAPRIIELLSGAMAELKLGDPARLDTDIGPVISAAAREGLEQHRQYLTGIGTLLGQAVLPEPHPPGHFFAPCAFEIEALAQLPGEIFGPILHIIRYRADQLDHVLDQINASGYGLTLGIHSRIDSTVEYISQRLRVDNAYVNRNMIGAVVGTQPFGGEGLSGTGPKAGGPYYLHRFATERVLTINTAAVGGNATLLAQGSDEAIPSKKMPDQN